MTTTPNTITISFNDADAENVNAAYYQIENGWVTFKSEEHKAVASYPESRVASITGDQVKQALTRKEAVDKITEVIEEEMSTYATLKYPEEEISLARSIAGTLVLRGYHPFTRVTKPRT